MAKGINTQVIQTGGGGGGAVDSVNGQTGVVVLDTGDISSVVNSRYVTDAQLVVIGNTSGVNTGDEIKGIVEVNFGANTQEDHQATTTVADTNITATSYPVISPYAIATTDHDPDDYHAEGVSVMITNVVAGVGFDVVAYTHNHTWGKYKFVYQY